MDVNGKNLIIRMNDAFQRGCGIPGAFRSSVESTVFTDRLGKTTWNHRERIIYIYFFTLLYFTFLFSTDTTPEVATWQSSRFLDSPLATAQVSSSGWLGSAGRERASASRLTWSWSRFLGCLAFFFFPFPPIVCLNYSFTTFCNPLFLLFFC